MGGSCLAGAEPLFYKMERVLQPDFRPLSRTLRTVEMLNYLMSIFPRFLILKSLRLRPRQVRLGL